MPESRAEEIIRLRDSQYASGSNWRSVLQETADLEFPRENQITSPQTVGADKTQKIYDTTALFDGQDMASGMSAAIMPTGQKFFGLTVRNKQIASQPYIKRYLAELTEITHQYMWESNFPLQFNETLCSLIFFGTGNLYSEWDADNQCLNYRDYDIAMYQFLEDSHGRVDTMILTFPMDSRQLEQQFGKDKLTKDILDAQLNPDTAQKTFDIIHYVGPRKDRNRRLVDSKNMPFESFYVDVKNKRIIDEGGFEEFPFAVARWKKSGFEKWGRGQGTDALSTVKMLQQIKKDFINLSNKICNPPLEVEEGSFEGTRVNLTPGAENYVRKIGSIQGISQSAIGNFPITEQAIELFQEEVHRAFFRDVFVQMGDLKGDRRTTVEIRAREREGLRRLSQPVARLEEELLTPNVDRSILLILRNVSKDKLPQMPPELAGQKVGIEYVGELGLALRDNQAKGFIQFAEIVGALTPFVPDAVDFLETDTALPDVAESWGVKTEHVATPEKIAAKRAARQQQLAAAQALQAGQVAADAYQKGSSAPEKGSPSEQVMAAVGS